MTLDDIKQALTPCFSGNLFTGPDTLFGSATLQAVFDASLPDSKLVIEGSLAETADAVTITGVGQGPFATMVVTATFTPSGDSDVAVVVTGSSGGGWSFAVAFPTLADTPLGGLVVLSGATLVLTTIPDDGSTGGLVFTGAVRVAGGLSQVTKLIGSVASLGFSGPISFTSGEPVFTLQAAVTTPFPSARLKILAFTAVLKALAAPQVGQPAAPALPGPQAAQPATTGTAALPATQPAASMALETTVAIDLAGGKVTLPAAINFSGSGGVVDLVITAPQASGVSIANLLPWSLGGDLKSLLPPPNQFDPSGALTLDSIDFTINPAVPALEGAKFQLSSSKAWDIDSKVAIGGIALALDVDVTSGKPSPSGTLSGNIAIGQQGSICTLDVSASLPDGTFAGSLDANSKTPNVSALVTYFLGDFSLPEIDLTALTFSAAPTTSTYSISAGFTSAWTLQIGEHGLSITGASVDLGKGADGITGSVQGTLVLDTNHQFDASYTLPGSFSISAQIPSIQLSTVVAALCKPLDVSPPGSTSR